MDGSVWQHRIVTKMVLLCRRYHGSRHSDRHIGDRVDAILLRQTRNDLNGIGLPHALSEGTAPNIIGVSRGLDWLETLLKLPIGTNHDLSHQPWRGWSCWPNLHWGSDDGDDPVIHWRLQAQRVANPGYDLATKLAHLATPLLTRYNPL